ncbi:MAG: hypothetical protein IJ643_00890, partial [Eubacterium sp.]|nr:hypothetical protein [Eubacterium sp.]
RGKRRIIVPIQFEDRMTQRVICDYSMVPIFQRTLIYDNGASTPGKGTIFARKRMDLFFEKAIKQYGDDFYILTFDFKSFFDSIPHSTCYNVLSKNYEDKRMVNLIMEIVKSYQRPSLLKIEDKAVKQRELYELEHNMKKGICLGSQVSQILALIVPNEIDHLIKDVEGFKLYERFMDDGSVFDKSKEALKALLDKIRQCCEKLGLKLNEKKTRIVKATKGFSFLKVKYRVVKGKLLKTLAREGTVRMRRKLKKFRRLVDEGKMTYDDVYNSVQAWLSHSKIAKSYKTVKSMMKLYNELFSGYKITKMYKKHYENEWRSQNVLLQSHRRDEYRWGCDYLRAA